MNARDFTVSASTDAVIVALLRKLHGKCSAATPITLTAGELARAEQVALERRANGHTLELRIVEDT